MEIPKAYEAKNYENDIYKRWEKSGLFNPDRAMDMGLTKKNAPTFSIVLPPPNVTGELHLGHATMLAHEDLMVRFARLQGKQTLWLPGTDHAAIATQTRVEKILDKEGVDKKSLGRKKFITRVKEYVGVSQDTIHRQIRKMGASLDWSREKYTLDDDISDIVKKAFVQMYKDELIYRGYRIVNWCPRCASTLADDEVEYKEEKTSFYYFKYGPVIIGTARPETKFTDKVVIVHPEDKRYKKLIGKKFTLPWIEGIIEARVIADSSADPKMGTGAMTITPAHSFVDFELAQKYDLPVEKIIDEQGNLTSVAGSFAGQPARQARDQIVAKLKKQGLVASIDKKYIHNLSVCYRCGTAVEPLPSLQWFVNVNKKIPTKNKSLKELSLAAVKNIGSQGKIEIIPSRFEKIYKHWMENLHDWCISRQIWWGHRIPVWYKDKSQDIYVGLTPPKGQGWRQDEDTLDTWFSSALWTFSTLGWPEGEDFKKFHPTQVLETGYDIIFFWVARMILMTLYLTDEIPFEKVYLHGLVRDKQGRKMSKSLGNGIDPLEMIEKFGADALRLSMIIGSSAGSDLNLYEEKIAGYRNFVNKLWNISRFILSKVEKPFLVDSCPSVTSLSDQWILFEFNELIKETTTDLQNFNFSPAGERLYEFTWSKLADWYLEVAKIEKEKENILNFILQKLLILWHPFAPFVTETIWTQAYNKKKSDKQMLMVQSWVKDFKVSKKGNEFNNIKNIVISIRNLRAQAYIDPGQTVPIKIKTNKQVIKSQSYLISRLARVDIEFIEKLKNDMMEDHIRSIGDDYEIFIEVKKNIQNKLVKEKKELEKYINGLEKKLSNKSFVSKAPPAVVEKEKEKLKLAKEKLNKYNKSHLD